MHLLPVDAAIPLRSEFIASAPTASSAGFMSIVRVFTWLVTIVLWHVSVFAEDNPARQDEPSENTSISRYAEIAPQSEEDVVELLDRISEYAQTERLFDDPIVVMLHGAEARVFTRRNYSSYRSVVDLAKRLDAEGVIDVQICEVWMSKNGMEAKEMADFIKPVPYGVGIIEDMVEAGSIQF
ncbi:MAG: hypothetical protein KUG75_07235 [Pseudomonadales bacterium]|nr:hypothetical protein [Pseudomonadales bacterium]